MFTAEGRENGVEAGEKVHSALAARYILAPSFLLIKILCLWTVSSRSTSESSINGGSSSTHSGSNSILEVEHDRVAQSYLYSHTSRSEPGSLVPSMESFPKVPLEERHSPLGGLGRELDPSLGLSSEPSLLEKSTIPELHGQETGKR